MFMEGDGQRLLADPRDIEYGTGNGLNPILFALRLTVLDPDPEWEFPEGYTEIDKGVAQWVEWLKTGNQEVSWDADHLAHAEAVIYRLARLRGLE
jgi:hypothetical protein